MELTHPIDQFCMPPSTNNGCLEADHNGGIVRVCLVPSASLSVMEAHSLVASVGIMGRDWPAGPLREAASGAAGDHVVPPAQSGLTLYKSALLLI